MATVSVGPTGNNTGYATAAINAWLQSNYEKMWGGISPVFALLAAKGRVQAGGLGYKIPVRYPAASGPATTSTAEYAGGSGDAFAALDFVPVVGLTEYEFKPAEYLIPFAVEQYQLDNLSNKTQVADYMEAVVQQALDRHMWDIMQDFWRDPIEDGDWYQFVGGQNRKAFGSILQYLNCGSHAGEADGLTPAELAAQGVIGVTGTVSKNISASWPGGLARPVVTTTATKKRQRFNTPMKNAAEVVGPTTLGPLYNLACNGNDMPDIIVVNRTIFDKIESSITTAGGSTPWGIQSPGVAAQLGIPSIRYKGADIVMDESCPTTQYTSNASSVISSAGNVVLCINSKYIGFRFSTGKPALNKDEPSIRPEIKEASNDGRPIKRWVGRVVGQMVASNLGRVHSRHNAMTPS